MGFRLGIRSKINRLTLNKKIQFTFILFLVPLMILFIGLLTSVGQTNSRYNQMIENATAAAQFSINFKEEFDYKMYRIIAGNATFEEEDPYDYINVSRVIGAGLVVNTTLSENKWRAQSILRMLDNLERYVLRIEANKIEGGFYDENFNIWEKDIQIVTALIQSTIFQYVYDETKNMETVRAQVSDDFKSISITGIAIFLGVIVVMFFLSFFIPKSIVKPIHHLSTVTKQVANGQLEVRAHVYEDVELNEFCMSLNTMIEKMQALLETVKIEAQHLREAELRVLQSQINPHFLYNTLDAIMWLSETGRHQEVVLMVKDLSDFFRTSLNYGHDMVTLSEEEKHVVSYLKIQQVRYQDILSYTLLFDDNLSHVMIPKITLQPLVENALYHGIKNKRGKGHITVCTNSDEDNVYISVRDNGRGMLPERLEQVTALLSDTGDSALKENEIYGLFNVHQRIRLKYGNGYGLSISSVLNEGTQVIVKLPLHA